MGKNIWCFFSFLTEAIILWQYTSTLFAAKRTAKKGAYNSMWTVFYFVLCLLF